MSGPLRQLDDDLWVVDRPQRFLGIEVGTRMTVARLADGLWLSSPVSRTPELDQALAELGPVRWVVAPNKYHHLYAREYVGDATVLAAPGLPAKRPDVAFDGEIDDQDVPWDEIEAVWFRSWPLLSELAFLHRPSRTLIVADLVHHIQPDDPWLTRTAYRFVLGYPGFCSTLIERATMRRRGAREEMRRVLDWEFDRVVMAHGAVLETGGREAMADAYSWLLK